MNLPVEPLIKAQATHPDSLGALLNFIEISRISRPSHYEEKIRLYIQDLATSKGLQFKTDTAGNLLVVIPSNIESSREQPAVMIQSHLDLVPKVVGISQLADAEAFYERNSGVMPLEYVDGKIRSQNEHNTIGADNGAGVAMMLQYIKNPELKHPPLELLFTTREEVGLLGVSALEIPLTAKYGISLDSGFFREALVGSTGASRISISGALSQSKKAPSHHSIATLQLNGFEGGHSAMKIKLGRANGVHEMNALLIELKKEIPELEVVSLQGGVEGTFNAIPNEFKMQVSLPESQKKLLEAQLEKYVQQLKQKYLGIESFQKFSLTHEFLDTPHATLPWNEVESLLAKVSEIPSGPNSPAWSVALSDPEFSSNTAFFTLNEKGYRVGVMPRFMLIEEYNKFKKFMEDLSRDSFKTDQMTVTSFSPSWVSPDTSTLRTLLQKNIYELGYPIEQVIAKGGVEASVLSNKYPDMQLIVIGPEVLNMHETSEALPIDELAMSVRLLDNLIQDIAAYEASLL